MDNGSAAQPGHTASERVPVGATGPCAQGLTAFAMGDYRAASSHFANLPRELAADAPCHARLRLRLFLAGKPDPWLLVIYGACTVLFGVVAAHYFGWG